MRVKEPAHSLHRRHVTCGASFQVRQNASSLDVARQLQVGEASACMRALCWLCNVQADHMLDTTTDHIGASLDCAQLTCLLQKILHAGLLSWLDAELCPPD
jgi:hypothetical protein